MRFRPVPVRQPRHLLRNREFWLRGKLRITPKQEVDFLRRMEAGQLPVKPDHVALVRRPITLESTPAYTLQGKTGSGTQDGRSLGWLVGFVETPAGKWIYAFLALAAPGKQVPSREARVVIVKKLLSERTALSSRGARPDQGDRCLNRI